MVRVITQETYDEVVKENIEEFEMSPEEAMNEAKAQFEAQGVDLSNIIKDLALCTGNNHLVSEAVSKLKKLCAENSSDDDILNEMQVLKKECEKDIARRVRAGKEGIYPTLIALLEAREKKYLDSKNEKDAAFLIAVLNTLTALMDVQPDLLEYKGIEFIKSTLNSTTNEDILIATLRWTSTVCIKHEMNRQNIFSQNIVADIKMLLDKPKNLKLLSETLQVIRRLCLDDDVRMEFGKAHDHSKELGVYCLDRLTQLLKEHTKPPLVSELMLTIATLLVRNELCAMVGECTYDLLNVLTDNYDNVGVTQQATKLITALAGNDDVKRKLVTTGIAPIIVALLSRHASNAQATALCLKCVAALTLREPAHSAQFLDSGAPEAIIHCMKVHPDNCSVQKNACWAIRNIVARCRDQNVKFLELGAEPLLNMAYDKFEKDFGFDIKSALRDLECNVKLEEQWTGKGVEIEQ